MKAQVWYRRKDRAPVVCFVPENEGDRLTIDLLRASDRILFRLGTTEKQETLLKVEVNDLR